MLSLPCAYFQFKGARVLIMGFFDEWLKKDSDYVLATEYVEQLARQYDSGIKATASYLLWESGFSPTLYFKQPNGEFIRDKTLYEEEHNYDEAPYEFFTHIINNISEYKYTSFETDAKHIALRYADRYFYKDELPIIDTPEIELALQEHQVIRDDELFHQLEQAKAKIDILEKEQSTGSFMMGTPEVTSCEPKTDRERVIELEKELAEVKAELKEYKDVPTDDKDLAPNSQAKVACMLYAILKTHDYDLSPPMGKGLANDLIVNASQVQGTPVTKNFVAEWLKRANQAKINCSKK